MNEWVSKYAMTFHNLYWRGAKRHLLEKARGLEPESYILHVIASPSSKNIFRFIDREMLAPEVGNFKNLEINLPNGILVKGLDSILELANFMHNACSKNKRGFVLAVFDVPIDDDTVLRYPSLWMDPLFIRISESPKMP